MEKIAPGEGFAVTFFEVKLYLAYASSKLCRFIHLVNLFPIHHIHLMQLMHVMHMTPSVKSIKYRNLAGHALNCHRQSNFIMSQICSQHRLNRFTTQKRHGKGENLEQNFLQV